MDQSFRSGEFVWVKKAKLPWWPAVVVREEDCPLQKTNKKKIFACVKFVPENTFDFILDSSHIKPFECPEKEELIRKADKTWKKGQVLQKIQFDKAVNLAIRRSPVKTPPVKTSPQKASVAPRVTERSQGSANQGGSPHVKHSHVAEDPVWMRALTTDKVKEPLSARLTPSPDRFREILGRRRGSHSSGCSSVSSVDMSPCRSTKPAGTFTQKKLVIRKRQRDSLPGQTDFSGDSVDLPAKVPALDFGQSSPNLQTDTETGPHQPDSPHPNENHPGQLHPDVNHPDPHSPDVSHPDPHNPDQNHTDRNHFEQQLCLPTTSTASSETLSSRPTESRILCDSSNTDSDISAYQRAFFKKSYGCKGGRKKRRCRSISDVSSTSKSVVDSDDEDLPTFLETKDLEKVDPVCKGDLAWGKYGTHPYWPALVLEVYLKKKKAKVLFLGKTWRHYSFKVKLDRVLPYAGKNLENLKVPNIDGPLRDDFNDALEEAEDFITRSTLGEVQDSFSYFLKPEDHDLDVYNSEVSSTNGLDNDEPEGFHGNIEYDQDEEDESMQEDSVPFTEDDQEPEQDMSEKLKMSIEKRQRRNQKVVDFIKHQKMKDYLFDIYHNKRKSPWQDWYNKPDKTKEEEALHKTYGFGPIAEEQQQEEVMNILMDLYKELEKDSIISSMQYIFSVWMPEAIIYAISQVRRVTRERAEEIFKQGPHYLKEEHKIIQQEVVQGAENIDEEDRARHHARIQRTWEKLKNDT